MTKKLIPLLILALFIISSCGSDSENADINKEWTLIDMAYSGESMLLGGSVVFDGQLVEGNATMQFSEEPNTVRSQGMYTIQLESEEDGSVRVSRQEATFDQFGTWTRNGNVISTSAENSFDTDLIIASISEDKMALDFDYNVTVDVFGEEGTTSTKGTYFLASPEYISSWKELIKGGWSLTNAEYVLYEGNLTQVDGIVDKLSKGTYKSGNAPLEFGETGGFLASGSYNVDLETTEYIFGGPEIVTTSSKINSFFTDGSYSINGRMITITESGGNVRTLSIIDVTDETLTLFESSTDEPMGSFELITMRTGVRYTLERKAYEAITQASIIGEWSLSDYSHNLDVESTTIGSPFTKVNSVAELISSTAKMNISDNPNTIMGSGTYELKLTQTDSGITSTSEEIETLFSADNWIKTDNEIQFFGSDFFDGISTFNIEELNQFELILTENINYTEELFGFEFKTTGTRTFTFSR